MSSNEFIYGYYFSNNKSNQPYEAISSLSSLDQSRQFWLHFDYTEVSSIDFINKHLAGHPVVSSALINEETRPRATAIDNGVLLSLRGVNFAPNSNPEDMVAIRLWVTENAVVSTRNRKLLSAADIANDFEQGKGPENSAEFVVRLTELLISRMSVTIEDIEDKVFQIEERILTDNSYSLRNEISDIRRQIISLRRYLAPQKEAMNQLLSEKITLFNNEHRLQMRETLDHLTRLIEDLDSVRDRAAVTQEELSNDLSEQMNNRMYVLSIVAAIFLPLGFLTGLWGVNVGGIPGADNPVAFGLFVAILVIIIVTQVWIFKRNKWF